MAPRVNPGDVVVTHPVTAAELRTGQVVLVHDPQVPGGLLLHRLVSFDEDGRLVTRGDANQSDDSVHAAPSEVRGLAVMRVPWVGLPALWRAQGRYDALALAAGVLVIAAVFASRGWGRRAPAAALPIHQTSSSSAAVRLSMTGAVRPASVRSFARSGVPAAEGEGHSASSTRYVLPPVPPAVGRPGGGRSPAVVPAGARIRPADDHSGCLDGGRFCGRPRR
jgi:signal peptidase